MSAPCVALLTDFGSDSPFVGVMKAVVLRRAPEARVLDVHHGVTPFDIEEGAFWLQAALPYLPEGAVVAAVVDPGVGTARRILAARCGAHCLLAPDNGLLPRALDGWAAVYRTLDLAALQRALDLPEPSATFHGRDVFAPVAAALAAGRLDFADLGPQARPLPPPGRPWRRALGEAIEGWVVSVDRFGNCITTLRAADLPPAPEGVVRCAGRSFRRVRTYGEAAAGEAVALIDSFGMLELAEVQGDLARRLGIGRGETVRWSPA
ncbi:MAG: hypothetical protein KatS3mg121_1067 [Gammaproteobacteria bacterium]|nr:MAG: hypothetical protein KatS3mg121_1067 [Gammaproteobacteria bacterium]